MLHQSRVRDLILLNQVKQKRKQITRHRENNVRSVCDAIANRIVEKKKRNTVILKLDTLGECTRSGVAI